MFVDGKPVCLNTLRMYKLSKAVGHDKPLRYLMAEAEHLIRHSDVGISDSCDVFLSIMQLGFPVVSFRKKKSFRMITRVNRPRACIYKLTRRSQERRKLHFAAQAIGHRSISFFRRSALVSDDSNGCHRHANGARSKNLRTKWRGHNDTLLTCNTSQWDDLVH